MVVRGEPLGRANAGGGGGGEPNGASPVLGGRAGGLFKVADDLRFFGLRSSIFKSLLLGGFFLFRDGFGLALPPLGRVALGATGFTSGGLGGLKLLNVSA